MKTKLAIAHKGLDQDPLQYKQEWIRYLADNPGGYTFRLSTATLLTATLTSDRCYKAKVSHLLKATL